MIILSTDSIILWILLPNKCSSLFFAIHLPPVEEGEFLLYIMLNEKFTKARRTGTESSAVSGLVRPSCLIIDEIGRSIFDMENTRLFFDMIDRRCSKEGPNCMIFTSNLTPDKWRDFFREEDSLLCALDRTFDAATVYLMKGESYRGRNLKTYSIEISDPAE